MSDRIAEIRGRLDAAGLTGPMRVRVGYEGARHIALIDHGRGLDGEEVAARTYEADDARHEHAWPRARLLANAPSDIEFLLGEEARLRSLLRSLWDAQQAHEEADTVAMRATFNDAPDTGDCLDAMGATARALDDAWDAVAREMGEEAGTRAGEEADE